MARSTLPVVLPIPALAHVQEQPHGLVTEANVGLITGGVDTHLDVHVVAALSPIGGLLGTASFPTTPAGYQQLLGWLRGFGELGRVGVEGTSSYGAGLCRVLRAAGVTVLEVDRPKRQIRRRVGKSDTLDAIAAARAVLAGDALGAAKTKDGAVEGIRVLTVVRGSAVTSRTMALNQLRALIVTAPEGLREHLRDLTIPALVATCAALRPGTGNQPQTLAKIALQSLARRIQHLDYEISELDVRRTALIDSHAPTLLAIHGVGPQTAATLLITVGDNPDRIRSEAAFARICGVAPIPAGSGKTNGHQRLHRGGDRQANSALWTIVLTRMATHAPTRAYVARRTKEGLDKRAIMRCLKRYLARELYTHLNPRAASLSNTQSPLTT